VAKELVVVGAAIQVTASGPAMDRIVAGIAIEFVRFLISIEAPVDVQSTSGQPGFDRRAAGALARPHGKGAMAPDTDVPRMGQAPGQADELPRGVEALRQAFALTKAEAPILEQLATGSSLAEAAERLGVARATAKSQLMRVFARTGVSRQSDLIHLAMTLVPPVRRP
jgi:DNA-binding CsgD family transcriptional regulator